MPLSYDWEVVVAICACLVTFFALFQTYVFWLDRSTLRTLKKMEHLVDERDPAHAEEVAIPNAKFRILMRTGKWQLVAFATISVVLWSLFLWSRISH